MDARIVLGTDVAHVVAGEGQDLGQPQLVALHIGAGDIPGVPHNVLVLGEELAQSHAKLAGAMPGILAHQQEIRILIIVQRIVHGVHLQLAQLIALQVEQAEVLQPVGVLQHVDV